jgi:predicted RNase H-like HicB family nuclease
MIKKLNINKNLHILIIEDKDKNIFLAHCLDMDIVSQGKTPKEALSELKELIQLQIEYCLENDMLDNLFRPASKEYWDRCSRKSQDFLSPKMP